MISSQSFPIEPLHPLFNGFNGFKEHRQEICHNFTFLMFVMLQLYISDNYK